jgi:hypothetical protein
MLIAQSTLPIIKTTQKPLIRPNVPPPREAQRSVPMWTQKVDTQPVYIVRRGVWQGCLHQSQQIFMQIRPLHQSQQSLLYRKDCLWTNHRPSAGPQENSAPSGLGGNGCRSSRLQEVCDGKNLGTSCLKHCDRDSVFWSWSCVVVTVRLPQGLHGVFKAAGLL